MLCSDYLQPSKAYQHIEYYVKMRCTYLGVDRCNSSVTKVTVKLITK